MNQPAISPDLQRRIAISNEKSKLEGSLANNIAVSLFSGGVILPVVAWSYLLPTKTDLDAMSIIGAVCIWTLATWAAHEAGKRLLENIL